MEIVPRDNTKDTLLVALLRQFCADNDADYKTVMQELRKRIEINDSDATDEMCTGMINALKFVGGSKGRFGREFTDLSLIGTGAFGKVYSCRNVLDANSYAIKRIPVQNDPESALREARTLSKIQHPNVVRYHSVWARSDSCLYLQMELCQRSLKQYFAERIKIKRNDVSLFFGVLAGLDYLHRLNVLHRDLKPANIVIKDGVAKICDFHLSRTVKQNTCEKGVVLYGKNESITKEIGSELYSAPEQLTGEEYDKSADVYSLGLIYFEFTALFTDNWDRIKSVQKIRDGDYSGMKLSDRRVVEKMLSRKKEDRPTTKQLIESFQKRFRLPPLNTNNCVSMKI